MIKPDKIADLSREELLELNTIFAKNWLAHDGSWFLSIEEKYGMEMAIEMDREAWRKFTVVEARRLIEFLQLGESSGIRGLKKALSFRLHAAFNHGEIIESGNNTLIYKVKDCRVQAARRRKGLPAFPCKSVGIVEYGLFAQTIDARFTTETISCHPDIAEAETVYDCVWRFTLADG